MNKRFERKRSKGWRNPPNSRYVGRGTAWGNPFKIGPPNVKGFFTRQVAIEKFKEMVAAKSIEEKISWLKPLRGMDLLCYCREGTPCHADILLAEIDRLEKDNAFEKAEQKRREELGLPPKQWKWKSPALSKVVQRSIFVASFPGQLKMDGFATTEQLEALHRKHCPPATEQTQ